jgi:rhodanese-related sulfurtransferase/CBS domain-containing protein
MPERIDAARVVELRDRGAQIVEVLPEPEHREHHIAGAISLPLKELTPATASRLDPRRPVVVYCWDSIWDLSPRAACRLETLGFSDVYDYVVGKQDWLARGLPIEGEKADVLTAGVVAKNDVVTCGLTDRVGDVQKQVLGSPYRFALVISVAGHVLGRLRESMLEHCDPESSAEEVMQPGPSTVRFDIELPALVERLRARDFKFAVVTTPGGILVGVVRRSDVERHLSDEGPSW